MLFLCMSTKMIDDSHFYRERLEKNAKMSIIISNLANISCKRNLFQKMEYYGGSL